jgi:hypothetical protein
MTDDEPGGAFSELLRMQAEFQARLTDETLRYLRRLQGVLAPHAPGTVVQADPSVILAAQGRPGDAVDIETQVENRQRVHTVLSPSLTPLVSSAGTTWFPAFVAKPAYTLLAAGETTTLVLTITIPAELAAGCYRGALTLRGFGGADLPVAVDVVSADIDTEGGAR